jgi:hypothetical protein
VLGGGCSTKEDSDDVEREVAIMYHLGGHDNIVNLKQAYEDKNNVQLVRGGLAAPASPTLHAEDCTVGERGRDMGEGETAGVVWRPGDGIYAQCGMGMGIPVARQ